MDDEQFRCAKAHLDAPICEFEKALQHGYLICQHASATQIGERQALSCQNSAAHNRCRQFLADTVRVSGFAMGQHTLPAHLSFAQAMKVQVGGLQGLVAQLGDNGRDVANLLALAASQEDAVNFSALMPAISAFELPRRRATGRKSR